jgi:hypothetical protein
MAYYNMTPRFIQANCVEGKRIDLRQANVVKKYKPDIILFEIPAGRSGPSLIFNKFSPEKKPVRKVAAIKKGLRTVAHIYPYALSDIRIWENIETLWREGKNTLLFNIDVSEKLRTYWHKEYGDIPYRILIKQWWFWVYLLMREREMKENVEDILRHYKGKKRPIVAVFLQSIHWDHVQFLLSHPSEKAVWKYYFGKFSDITPANIGALLKEMNKVLYGYWRRSGY